MPWTIPVVGAGGVTTVEEGMVGASAAPHAISSDITAQSAHAGAILRTIGDCLGISKGFWADEQNTIREGRPQCVDAADYRIADTVAHVAPEQHHCCARVTPDASEPPARRFQKAGPLVRLRPWCGPRPAMTACGTAHRQRRWSLVLDERNRLLARGTHQAGMFRRR